jgi:DNA-binding NarL/FixJ family response regulator
LIQKKRSFGQIRAFPNCMILLISSSSSAPQLQQALQTGVAERVETACSVAEAVQALRTREFSALVLDQSAETERGANTLMQHAGNAVPLRINSAVANSTRVIQELKSALRRRQADRVVALKAATVDLRDGLRNAVTGILLSSELALDTPCVPPSVQARLHEVVQLAQGMKRELTI